MVGRIGGPNMIPDDDPDAWLRAVVDRCEPEFEALPHYLRVDAATALYVESRVTSNPDIPCAVVFDDQEPQHVNDLLLITAKTADRQTPSHNPELRYVVRSVDGILRKSGIERGPATATAAALLVRRVAEKPDVSFKLYADNAREMPQRFSWGYLLEKQFGNVACRTILNANLELEDIISRTERLTGMYYEPIDLDYQSPPDAEVSMIHGFMPNDDRLRQYVTQARQIRGLSGKI